MAVPAEAVTGHAQKKAWSERSIPPVEQVRDGLWSVPVPRTGSGIRYVLTYAFELDGGRLAILDPGWNHDECWNALDEGLRSFGHSVTDIDHVLVSHFHPDHLGLADRVRAVSGAPVIMHPDDLPLIPPAAGRTSASMDRTVDWLYVNGYTQAEAREFDSTHDGIDNFLDLGRPTAFLSDGERAAIPGWDIRAVHTPGHTPGHLCFHLPELGVVLTGDHLLPRITSHVSSFPMSGVDPLHSYIESLQKVAALGATEALPAHEYRFTGIPERAAELVEHHEERSEEILSVIDSAPQPMDANAICHLLTWSQPWTDIPVPMRRAALSETLAHLMYLQSNERLARTENAGGQHVWVSGSSSSSATP